MATLAEAFGKVIATILKALISGLFKDVLGPLASNVTSAIQVDPGAIHSDLTGQVDRYRADYARLYAAYSPLTPEEAHSRVLTWEILGNLAAAGVIAATIATEVISIGQIDFTLSGLWNLPTLRAYLSTTERFGQARDEATILLPLQRYLRQRHRPLIPGAGDIADLHARGWITSGSATEGLEESGFRDEYIGALINAAFKRPDVATLTRMLYRKQIDEAGYRKGLKLLGIPEVDHPRYLALTEWIPPIEDLRLMAVREAFPVEPGPPQYEELYKWGALHGLSQYWVDRYLYMGFIRMDPRLAMDYFLYRHYMPDEYEAWLRIADIHPDDRPPMVEVAFRPPTLYQARRGWEAGIYADEDLIRFNRWRGMNPADAETAAFSDFEWVLRADRGALEGDLERDYLAGYATIDQIRADLAAIGFSAKRIDLRLAHYETRAEHEHKDALVDIYRDAYQKDLIVEPDLEARLKEIIVRPEVVERILEREYVRKYRKPKAD